ncbi:MAG TPA: SDR family oxidoreductase [Gemmataceae bacterium]|jgi:NADP-dependent 3-hydroxy acid dehydrogenase YdfG|nr:SDR family oxidoreductase [Gemmataceae bacterium]
MSRLAGKAALVTGGGSGIGLATARALLAEGARVAIAGRSADKLRQAAADLAAGDRLLHQAADVTDPAQVQRLVQDVTARLGKIDILVNNAGLNIKARAFRELTAESYHQLLGTNLHGAFYCMQAVVPQMRQRKDGLIVCVNSISGKRSGPLGGIAYNAAKFGLRGLAMGLGAEEKDNGIRVCSIYPGEVNTPILDNRPTPLSAERLRDMLQPEDVAAAVLFVATLPPRANVPELVITPSNATFV